MAFTIRNANNEGDYFDGIPPTCAAADDSTHQLGDVAEASFAEALTYIRTGACSAERTDSAAARAARQARSPASSGWAAIVNTW